MATLSTKSFQQIVQSWAAAAQAACATVLDFSTGSVSLAFAEGGATLGLWLQKLALQVLGLTRFATSTGSDADSWGADFDFARLPAVAATGSLTFSRSDTTYQAVVPVGSQVQTSDGTQSFLVTADASNPAFNATLNGYVVPAGSPSVTVVAQAVTAGPDGNVGASTISVIVSPITYVDAVNNSAAFANGIKAERDSDYKARFPIFLAGLASADMAAIESAILSVQQGLSYLIIENYDYPAAGYPSGPTNLDNGSFFVVINDGSGAPPSTLLTQVSHSVMTKRAVGVRFQGAYAPTPVTANVSMTITTDSNYTHGVVVQQVEAAIGAFIAALPLGSPALPITRLAQVAYDASPGVINVSGIQINSSGSDLALSIIETAVPGSITVA